MPNRNTRSWNSCVARPNGAAAGNRATLGATVLLLVLLAQPAAANPAPEGDPLGFEGIEKVVDPGFLRSIPEGVETVDVMVLLKGYRSYIGKARADNPVAMRAVQAQVAAAQERVLSSLDPETFQPGVRFENLLGFAGRATLAGVEELAAHPEVASIEEDGYLEPHLAQGLEVMNATATRFRVNGTGVAVGIIDSGIDYRHTLLGGPGFPNDKVIGGWDFGDNDSDPLDCHSHGTRVAGIVAGIEQDGPGDYIGGVAPGAKLYALKVGSGCNGGAAFSTVARAIDWAVTHQFDDPDNPILVLNASLGSTQGYLSACDAAYPTTSAAAASAAANGITFFASSGNSGLCDRISHPSCLRDVVSVGAVFDAGLGASASCISGASCVAEAMSGCTFTNGWGCRDNLTVADLVTCYSNSAAILDLLAPSNDTHTTSLSGGFDRSFGGTSAASPYAAGAAAVLQSHAIARDGVPYTVDTLRSLLTSTGDPVLDDRNGIVTPRVNLGAALVDLEICDDNQDNDGDTLIDCSDPDCNTDSDGDTLLDAPCGLDCDPTNDQVWGLPPTITGVRWTDGSIMEWTDIRALSGIATVYQVIRGRVSELPVGSGSSESCMATALPAAWLTERSSPPAGEAFYYVIRGRNSCSDPDSPYGYTTGGWERTTNLCP